jgi:hypothetical protein
MRLITSPRKIRYISPRIDYAASCLSLLKIVQSYNTLLLVPNAPSTLMLRWILFRCAIPAGAWSTGCEAPIFFMWGSSLCQLTTTRTGYSIHVSEHDLARR